MGSPKDVPFPGGPPPIKARTPSASRGERDGHGGQGGRDAREQPRDKAGDRHDGKGYGSNGMYRYDHGPVDRREGRSNGGSRADAAKREHFHAERRDSRGDESHHREPLHNGRDQNAGHTRKGSLHNGHDHHEGHMKKDSTGTKPGSKAPINGHHEPRSPHYDETTPLKPGATSSTGPKRGWSPLFPSNWGKFLPSTQPTIAIPTTLISKLNGNRKRGETWDHPGFGDYSIKMDVPQERLDAIQSGLDSKHESHVLLNELSATAICSNDILSSCFYTIGLVTSYAGTLAPISLLMVGAVLWLFRGIYGEAISAYPLNGGSYTVLLNTSSKAVAALGACLSIIAYIATGVVSAVTACEYLHGVWEGLHVVGASIGLLALFAIVVVMGLRESATVATCIFTFHVVTLLAILIFGFVYVMGTGLGQLPKNIKEPFPEIFTGASDISGGFFAALMFGFAGGMLGVSGFETSAQFVESQAPGVFLKTLRNMWIGVTALNPLLGFLAICILPLRHISFYSSTVLSHIMRVVGDWMAAGVGAHDSGFGRFLETWVAVDAFIVLSGAVLTAFVGIDGLIYQMAKDGCLPEVLLKKNTARGTHHNIILCFFVLAASQVLLLWGDVDALAGVYSFAFLGVMSIFCVGCMLLKFKRSSLPREVVCPWWQVFLGFCFAVLAFFLNLRSKPQYLVYFALYFLVVGLVVMVMFQRIRLLKILLFFGPPSLTAPLRQWVRGIRKTQTVFFCKKPDLYVMNKAVLYVKSNESTADSLLVVHCHDQERSVSDDFRTYVQIIDRMYPSIRVSFVTINAPFSPALVEYISKELALPKNMMFITCPDSEFRHRIPALGGLRVITH